MSVEKALLLIHRSQDGGLDKVNADGVGVKCLDSRNIKKDKLKKKLVIECDRGGRGQKNKNYT